MQTILFALLINCAIPTLGLYSSGDGVVELTAKNFESSVMKSDNFWVVEFYAPWCGHCKSLVPEYKKLASVLKGIAKVGAVDATQNDELAKSYGVSGFPTIKIFGPDKSVPVTFNGERSAKAIAESLLSDIRKAATSRMGNSDNRKQKEKKQGKSGGAAVVELTDSTFDKLVLNSNETWLVGFFAPWCGHCKNLKPHWDAAAGKLHGRAKLGSVDATVQTNLARRFDVRGYPTIKFFAPFSHSDAQSLDYDGGRLDSEIVSWMEGKLEDVVPPTPLMEASNQGIVEEICKSKQLCVFAFLPHILDCQAKCRNKYIDVLQSLSEKFRKNSWGWFWAESGKQTQLEQALEVGGFGYPALSVLNPRKMKFAVLKGAFSLEGIGEFLRNVVGGKVHTSALQTNEWPKLENFADWDGKDGVLPDEPKDEL